MGAESKTGKKRDRQRGRQQDRHRERHTDNDLLVYSHTQRPPSSCKRNKSQNKNPESFSKENHSSAVETRYDDALIKQEENAPSTTLCAESFRFVKICI